MASAGATQPANTGAQPVETGHPLPAESLAPLHLRSDELAADRAARATMAST